MKQRIAVVLGLVICLAAACKTVWVPDDRVAYQALHERVAVLEKLHAEDGSGSIEPNHLIESPWGRESFSEILVYDENGNAVVWVSPDPVEE